MSEPPAARGAPLRAASQGWAGAAWGPRAPEAMPALACLGGRLLLLGKALLRRSQPPRPRRGPGAHPVARTRTRACCVPTASPVPARAPALAPAPLLSPASCPRPLPLPPPRPPPSARARGALRSRGRDPAGGLARSCPGRDRIARPPIRRALGGAARRSLRPRGGRQVARTDPESKRQTPGWCL